MSRHEAPAADLWCTSDDEEYWHPPAYFDTKEEAVTNGRDEWDGGFWVGRCRMLTEAYAAPFLIKSFDDAECDLQQDEEFWNEDGDLIDEPTKEQRGELYSLVADWLKRHGLVRSWFNAEDVERVEVEEAAP